MKLFDIDISHYNFVNLFVVVKKTDYYSSLLEKFKYLYKLLLLHLYNYFYYYFMSYGFEIDLDFLVNKILIDLVDICFK